MRMNLLTASLFLPLASSVFAASQFTARMDDPKAVYLTAPEFQVHGDGMRR